MSQLLLNLRHVPEDEADEVRALLERNAIAWYETEPNRWGISAGAIWVREDDQFERARALEGSKFGRIGKEPEPLRPVDGRTGIVDPALEREGHRLAVAPAGDEP